MESHFKKEKAMYKKLVGPDEMASRVLRFYFIKIMMNKFIIICKIKQEMNAQSLNY